MKTNGRKAKTHNGNGNHAREATLEHPSIAICTGKTSGELTDQSNLVSQGKKFEQSCYLCHRIKGTETVHILSGDGESKEVGVLQLEMMQVKRRVGDRLLFYCLCIECAILTDLSSGDS